MAANELHFDPRATYVIGDKPCDIELGKAVGACTLLVRTGYGAEMEDAGLATADFVVDNLMEASEIIEGKVPLSSEL